MLETYKQSSKLKADIHIVNDEKLRQLIYKLRYKILVKEQHKNYVLIDHNNKILFDELDNECSTLVCATNSEGNPIAAIRLTWGDMIIPSDYKNYFSLHLFNDFPASAFSFTSKLVIDPRWRNSRVLGSLLTYSYQILREKKVQFNFCHANQVLAHLYERLGYRYYDKSFLHPYLGLQYRLVLLPEDINHLKHKRSIFLREAKKMTNNSTNTAEWFASRFKEYNLIEFSQS